MEIQAVFSCYPLLKQWLPALEAPRSQAGNLADLVDFLEMQLLRKRLREKQLTT